jgi:hypothetical protein
MDNEDRIMILFKYLESSNWYSDVQRIETSFAEPYLFKPLS